MFYFVLFVCTGDNKKSARAFTSATFEITKTWRGDRCFFVGPWERSYSSNTMVGIDSLFHDYLFIYFLREKERKREDKKNKKKKGVVSTAVGFRESDKRMREETRLKAEPAPRILRFQLHPRHQEKEMA